MARGRDAVDLALTTFAGAAVTDAVVSIPR
jgi:hypothetical protein